MSTVITVENLGKRYLLKHQSNRQPYVALRDVLSDGMKNFGQRLLGRGNSSVSDPRQEEFWALKDVSFEVKQGDRIGIIGRNGAGKSTLLKILSRITEPTTGCIRIKGRVASLLEVGTGFHPELTGRENIFLNGAILGMSRTEIKKKFDEIVDFAEIEKFLDTPVKRFSSGMYVRLAFAVAAHLEPEILVVDEVLAVGDTQFQKKCLGKMEDVSTREGRTVLFVSHNMGMVSQLCTKGMLLVQGRLAQAGAIKHTIDTYISGYETNADADLSRLSHGGSQEYSAIKRLVLYDDSLSPCTTFRMGSGIVADITVDCRKPMQHAELGLKICTLLDQPLYFFVSTWEGLNMDLAEGGHTFRVQIPEITLLPGRYLMGVWISKDGAWSDDNVSGATMIEIVSHDVTGYMVQDDIKNNFEKYSYSGSVSYLRSHWSLESSTEVSI